MVLTTPELIASLQNEVRILQHLITKIEPSSLDWRPTPTQRSVGELVRYLSMMGPALVRYGLSDPLDIEIWNAAEREGADRSYEQSVTEIGRHAAQYATLLSAVPDATFRSPMIDFDGNETSRGAFLVNLVLSGCAAYRTQLFGYLKACGQHHLKSANLWSGVDAATT